MCFGAAIPVACGSIYKSFAQCLVTLGDSLEATQKDQSAQDIDAICRYVCLPPVKSNCVDSRDGMTDDDFHAS